MHEITSHVFREYDIRGLAGHDLDEAFAFQLGQAFAVSLPATSHPVVVARDVRLSGPGLHDAVVRGLTSTGRAVVDIDLAPTPLAYFATHHLQAAGCVVVTGSHNPPEYNGFKLMCGLRSLHGEDIQSLRQAMQAGGFTPAKQPAPVLPQDFTPAYQEYVTRSISLARPLRVVIDAGNGPAGMLAAPVYRALGCEIIELYCEPDGTFPNHHPDPTVEENLSDLSREVLAHRADFGIAFDGDGDRIGVIDEQGGIIWGDMLLLLLARDVLKNHPGATIISEVKSSQHLYDDIRTHGGRSIMWRTGHSPIKAKMKETGAMLAGEMSGHIFFADRYFGFDDAIYAGARLMEVVAAQDRPVSKLLAGVPRSVTTPEIRVDCSDKRKFDVVEKAKAHFSGEGYDIIDVDGMRLTFDDGWALLRASNTQPSLVLRFEAPNEKRLAEMRDLVEGWLKGNS